MLADSDSDTDDDNDHDDDDDDGESDDGKKIIDRAVRRCHQTKLHGTVRVMWNDDDVSRHRVGQEGHVDVWCIDTAPGGQYYRDHLAVLDNKLMDDGDDDDDDDDDDEVTEANASEPCSITTPLGRYTKDMKIFNMHSKAKKMQ